MGGGGGGELDVGKDFLFLDYISSTVNSLKRTYCYKTLNAMIRLCHSKSKL